MYSYGVYPSNQHEKILFSRSLLEAMIHRLMQPLDKSLKIRFSTEMMEMLKRRAAERGPGTRLADLVREAVHHHYAEDTPRKKVAKKDKSK